MRKTRGGFTLIEMALSLVFVGLLSVMIVLLIQNTTSSYRRGLILNQLNTVGMDLIDDIRSSIQGASTDSLDKLCRRMYMSDRENMKECENDNGNSFVSVTKKAKVKVNDDYINNGDLVPVYGAFCTGTYTYIWNSGYFENGEHAEEREVEGASKVSLVSESDKENPINSNFRLLKIYDRERTVCMNAYEAQHPGEEDAYQTNTDNNRIPNPFVIDNSMLDGDYSDENKEHGVELLKQDEVSDLVLYDFYMAKPAMSLTRENLFFSGSFILGTRRGGADITVSGNTCKPPTDEYSDLEYCAINRFNFAVQAGGD